ncbi:MAG: glucosyl transferase, partial [Melioribacteraceae bacterium]|nr:glucosyl transferase [Melioribacteraceae bacterium]
MTNNNIAKILDLRFPFTRLLLLLFTFSFLLVSCDTTEPRNNGVLTLTPLDASCTEVWLKVENDANLIGVELTLFRDKQEYGSFTLTGTDTILFYGYLQPSTNYTFFAQINGIPSNTVNITTMDTTSHDFTWQTFTFGDGSGGSSYLNDVAIVDENNIWAVGMIYDNGEKYNAVHWD